MHPTDPATAAQTTADIHGLPTGRLTTRHTEAHIFLESTDGLLKWLDATGGYTTRRPAGPGVVMWTLVTHTEPHPDGTATPVLVHSLALDTEHVDDDLTNAAA
ncbi:hypothetical protein [Streptomyces griseorubiginosus]|uniref:hypothetical protein n=1 Tax=Streptomyces griseorubiginosus TaxID=67304 RepID=UPI0033CD2C16